MLYNKHTKSAVLDEILVENPPLTEVHTNFLVLKPLSKAKPADVSGPYQ
jgi:hypothetical protein